MDRRPVVILLDSSQLGGIETHVYHLSRALLQNSWPAEIWFYQKYPEQHPLTPRLESEGIKFKFLHGTIKHLHSELKSRNPLVLHTHGYKAGIFGRILAKVHNIPVVSTFHNGDPGEGVVRFYTWLDQITSVLSKNIAVSAEIAQRFKRPPVQINNFIDVPKQIITTGTSSAFAGRLSVEKGPDQFLQLAKHQPEMSFRLYGTGPMEQNLSQQHPDNVMFMGQVSGMNNQWQDIGQLCITSRHEGLPMVALEAMAHGVPVFSFRLGDLPQLIKQSFNGWISPLGDIKQMSDHLSQWNQLPESEKTRVRNNCINTVRSAYSYQAVLPRVLDIYRQACEESGQTWPAATSNNPAPVAAISGD